MMPKRIIAKDDADGIEGVYVGLGQTRYNE